MKKYGKIVPNFDARRLQYIEGFPVSELNKQLVEKSSEFFRRIGELGAKYTVFQDCIEIDAPEDKVEAVQNVLRELWPSGVVGE